MEDIKQKSYVFGALFILANRVQLLGDKIDPDMTIKQWLFITMIASSKSDAPTLSEVAKIMGSSRQNVKKMALILEKRDFIKLSRDEKDARAIRVKITQKCVDYFKVNDIHGMEFMEKLFEGFNKELMNGLYNGFMKLNENIIKMEKSNEEEE